ncbi:hypothetical protein MCAP1_000198 [Malassezia caprae]|uniref:Ubiquitin-like domain-containing protein n=1 Tax=Malassezia caprae TaxID=1381934 RepID=A0AAF0E8D2_9BASI|nr:hypothetical protein MCAP1_000198 [Malassezia caprae]
MSEAERDAQRAAPVLRLEVKSPSFDHSLRVDVDAKKTVSELKEQVAHAAHAARSAPHGWPQAHGIRCIYRGRILADDEVPEFAEQEAPVTLHIVVQPEAWRPYESPAPVAPAPESQPAAPAPESQPAAPAPESQPAAPAPESDPAAPAPSWPAVLDAMPPAELVGVAHAIYLTHAAYMTYLAELQQTHPSVWPVHLRLPRVPRADMVPNDTTQNEADLRRGAVALVERHVMHWTPWSDVCVDAQKAAPVPVAQYERVTLQGLPYLLCTHKAAPPLATAHALATQLLERVEHLQDAWVELACRLTVRERAPAPVPLEWITWPDVRVMLLSVMYMALRLLFVYMVVLPYLDMKGTWLAAAASVVFLVWHACVLLHRRWRERILPHTNSDEAHSAPATRFEAPVADAPGRLEIPHLPYRRPQGRPTQFTYWVQRLAWLGLEEEEVAMGFEHVPPENPPRIVWVGSDTYRTTRPAPLRRPVWLRCFLLPLGLFLLTIIPPIDECRADALNLRKDAILTLKKKWDEYREKPDTSPDARPPIILLHPYALALLAREGA